MLTTLDCLEQSLKDLTENVGAKINFHDIYGIVTLSKDLAGVISKYQIHHNPFCDKVKRSMKGFERCINCKNRAVSKAEEDKKPYYGYCYMGLGEYVYPVFFKDKLIAVIFIGEFANPKDSTFDRIRTQAEELGIDFNELKNSYDDITITASAQLIDSKVQLFIKLFQLFLYETGYKFTDAVYESNIVENAMSFIKNNYSNELSLELISSSCHCNPTYLSRMFKESTGINISEYVNRLRVEMAKTALQFTDKSITDIGYEVGFSDTAYFTRVFKKCIGVTPKEYRKNFVGEEVK